MFSISTQKRHWIYTADELFKLRADANSKFIAANRHKTTLPDEQLSMYFLTVDEEQQVLNNYQSLMRDFCQKFKPPMPKTVIGTALQYLKRFYLHNSLMDHHPKFIMVTCIYLACKVEEFNVSMEQFIGNIRGDRAKAQNIVLNNELLLMQQLGYHLTVHNPYRPVEGFLIDIKTRCLTAGDPERFRVDIDNFLEKAALTDALLIFTPSQIALAAVVYAAANNRADLDSYLTDILLADAPKEVEHMSGIMRILWEMIQGIEEVDKKAMPALEKKLEQCRSKENNAEIK